MIEVGPYTGSVVPSLLLLCIAGAAANDIKAEGGQALADALAPQKNPDGTWTFNNALKTLDLRRE